MPSTELLAISAIEIDKQIATAHQFPRQLARFDSNVRAQVTRSVEVAETMYYTLPRDGKIIEGPSVRFAEVISQNWNNCRSGSRVIGTDEKFVVAQGVFHDLETNVAISFEIKRRITRKDGTRYGDDMIGTTGMAAAGIAFRNAILKGVPKMFWQPHYEAAIEKARPADSDIAERRANALATFEKIGVSEEAILKTLHARKIGADELVRLRGIYNAIKEGTTTVAQAFNLNPVGDVVAAARGAHLEPTTEAAGRKDKPPKEKKKPPKGGPPKAVIPPENFSASDRDKVNDHVIGTHEQTEVYNQAIQHGWQVPEQVVAFLKAKYKISGIREIRRSQYDEIIAVMKKKPEKR